MSSDNWPIFHSDLKLENFLAHLPSSILVITSPDVLIHSKHLTSFSIYELNKFENYVFFDLSRIIQLSKRPTISWKKINILSVYFICLSFQNHPNFRKTKTKSKWKVFKLETIYILTFAESSYFQERPKSSQKTKWCNLKKIYIYILPESFNFFLKYIVIYF